MRIDVHATILADMWDLIFLLGTPALIGLGCLAGKLWFDGTAARPAKPLARRREDARHWQRHFGNDSSLATGFFPPTQNEVLETLYALDHLTPQWESGRADEAERAFLTELALNFPTLRKPGGSFPVLSANTPGDLQVAALREAFRARRAQGNALEQISAQPPSDDDAPSGEPAMTALGVIPTRRVGISRPALFALATVLGAATLYAWRSFPHASPPPPARVALAAPSPVLTTAPLSETALSPSPRLVEEAAAAVSSAPSPALASAAEITRPDPATPPAETPPATMRGPVAQVAASKQRAVAKYPALAVEGSEINLRFVFRYKTLAQQNSPRLLDPSWPEQLADECAAASKAPPKRNGFTRVLGAPR